MNQKFFFLIIIHNFNLLQFGVQVFLRYPSMHPGWNKLKIEIAKISATSQVWNRYTWQPYTNHTNQCIPMKRNIMYGKFFIGITEKDCFWTEIGMIHSNERNNFDANYFRFWHKYFRFKSLTRIWPVRNSYYHNLQWILALYYDVIHPLPYDIVHSRSTKIQRTCWTLYRTKDPANKTNREKIFEICYATFHDWISPKWLILTLMLVHGQNKPNVKTPNFAPVVIFVTAFNNWNVPWNASTNVLLSAQ